MSWTVERVSILRRHWGDMSARQIGKLIGKSKNAVLGKAHRLELSGEPNISGKPPGYRKPSKACAAPARRNLTSTVGCQWLEGEPRERKFCGAERRSDSSYCAEHHKQCWIDPRKYRSEAA